MRETLSAARRVVMKVGTTVVTRSDGALALGRIGAIAEQIHELRVAGREVLLVTSGAVGLGAEHLGFAEPPTGVVDRQACAAAGQGTLVSFYDTLLRRMGHRCAQVLLTEDDFMTRRRYVNLSQTLERLLSLGAVPIINENDTVSTAELALSGGAVFGDNDRLSALVASGLDADVLILLSDVDAVYSVPPGMPGATRVSVWDADKDVDIGHASRGGRGGMKAKIAAARIGAASGVHTVIASGRDPSVVERIIAGDDVGTFFPARTDLNRRRRWLAFATAPTARVLVNDGARRAVVERHASLLAPGIEAVVGEFDEGAIVSLCGPDEIEFARGICDCSSADVRTAMSAGGRGRPMVHCDNVVVLYREVP